MAVSAPKLVPFKTALMAVLRHARLLETETVSLGDALGRVLLDSVASPVDLPLFDNSAVDGYALHAGDIAAGTAGRSLPVVGESRAGSRLPVEIGPGACARVFTGAPLPIGAAGVAMQEDVLRDGLLATFELDVRDGDHIRRRGEELRAGDELVPMKVIDPAAIAALAGAGIGQVEVRKPPKVGVFVSGDQSAAPGAELGFGQVFESNGFGLRAALQGMGVSDIDVVTCGDDPTSTRNTLHRLIETCDIVITTGGVSVGDHDLVRPTLRELGAEERIHGVAVKPGKPFTFAVKGRTAIFGLPGNPVSVLVSFQLYIRPFLLDAYGIEREERLKASLTETLVKKDGRLEFVPCRLQGGEATPFHSRASHKGGLFSAANGLIVFPLDDRCIEAGSEVEIVPIRWGLLL